jgi:hypothetical protein
MSSSEKLSEWMKSVTEFLNEQVWFQQLKGKWEELDPQSRIYLKFAGVGCGILLAFIFLISSIWSVHSLKKELADKRNLLSVIQNANDEVFRLRSAIPGGLPVGGDKEGTTWSDYFESMVPSIGVDKSAISVASEKAGAANEQSKETLFELSLKHVNIKQVVRYAFALENGQRPVKLRNLTIDTKEDPTGYMDATLAVSAFTVVVTQ